MPRLKAARMTDATLVSSVDNETGALERDLANIFGIPLDTDITSPIFGSVAATGKIAGIVKFLTNNPTALDYSVGIEIEDSSGADRKFRIVTYGGDLNVYQWDDGTSTWELKQTLNDPISSIEDLEEVGAGFLAANTEKVLQVNADGDAIIGISASAAGAQALEDLTDVPAYGPGDALKILQIEDSADPTTTQWVTSAGASGANNLYELNDVDEVAIAAVNCGDVLAIDWTNPSDVVKYSKHMVAYGAQGAGTQPIYPGGSATPIVWTQQGSIMYPGTANPGCAWVDDWSIIGNGGPGNSINFPEPGPYFVWVNLTWDDDLNGTMRYVELVRTGGGNGFGVVRPNKYEPPYRLMAINKIIAGEPFVNLEKFAIIQDKMSCGFYYAEQENSVAQVQLKHDHSASVLLQDASIFICKLR